MTESLKNKLEFRMNRGVAEASSDNPHFVFNLDRNIPDRIVAFISPDSHRDIGAQFARNPDLDGVALRGSLSGLVNSVCEYLEDEESIDGWVNALEDAIGQLRAFQRERAITLSTSLCDDCAHSAHDHYRPNEGDINCRRDGCECAQFGPLGTSQMPPPPTSIRIC